MSWLFSQALVGAYSEANSLDGTPSAPSNTTPTPQAFLSRDKTTDAWSRFPSGMTCEPLTESRGEELLTWFRAGFPARTTAPESTSTTEATTTTESQCAFGDTWRELSVRFDRDSFSWKTVRDLFAEDLPESSLTLPQWGLMVDGELYQPKTVVRLTSAKDSGVYSGRKYPTPRTRDWKGECCKRWGNRHSLPGALADVLGGAPPPPKFSEWLMGWPIGWTDLEPLATDNAAQWLQLHGDFLADQ
jgi:hypothetical protein